MSSNGPSTAMHPAALAEGYRERAADPEAVLSRLREVEGRGRYQ